MYPKSIRHKFSGFLLFDTLQNRYLIPFVAKFTVDCADKIYHFPLRGALALLSITNISLIYPIYLIRDRYLCKCIAIDSGTSHVRSTVRDSLYFLPKIFDSRQCSDTDYCAFWSMPNYVCTT